MFRKLKLSKSVARIQEEKLYEVVAIELSNDNVNIGLWTKAVADAEGDDNKVKSLYIKYRVQSLIDEVNLVSTVEEKKAEPDYLHNSIKKEKNNQSKFTTENERADNGVSLAEKGFFGKLLNGDFGLAKTYWLYGVLVAFILSIPIKFITSIESIIIIILLSGVYQITVLMGVWRAANKYKGLKLWAVLAKIAAVLGLFILMLGVISVLSLIDYNGEQKIASYNNQQDTVATAPFVKAAEQGNTNAQYYEKPVALTHVTFTFSGESWVDITDATGERVAYGVKQQDYIMKISGQPPFKVALTKPEFVLIEYANEVIDMSQFHAENVVRFTLPIAD